MRTRILTSALLAGACALTAAIGAPTTAEAGTNPWTCSTVSPVVPLPVYDADDLPDGAEFGSYPRISGDGSTISYSTSPRYGSGLNEQRLVVRPLSGGVTRVFTPLSPQSFYPVEGGDLSRDGSYFTLSSRERLPVSASPTGYNEPDLDNGYLADLRSGTLRLAAGSTPNGPSYGGYSRVSDDGRYVAFSGILEQTWNAQTQVFVRDMATGALSQATSFLPGQKLGSWGVSADGKTVVYLTETDDSTGTVPSTSTVVVYDLALGARREVSVALPGGTPASALPGDFYAFTISADARYAAVRYSPAYPARNTDLVVIDLRKGTMQAMADAAGTPDLTVEGRRLLANAVISGNGDFVALSLVDASNSTDDRSSFVWDLRRNSVRPILAPGASGAVAGWSSTAQVNSISDNGRIVTANAQHIYNDGHSSFDVGFVITADRRCRHAA